MREGFAGPKGEPSAGCSEAQRNPQKPDPKGRALIILTIKISPKSDQKRARSSPDRRYRPKHNSS